MLALIFGLLALFTQDTTVYTRTLPKNDTLITSIDTTIARTIHVNRVIIIGNKTTRDRIISRELSLKPGDTISSKRIIGLLIWDQRKIYNLRLFNTVKIKTLEISDTEIDLLIEVTERWYTFPLPIFALSDRNFNEWYQNYHHDFNRVNYGISLTQHNFRGRNESVRLTAQLGFTRRFELSYRIPYIDKRQKQGLTFDFDYSEPKNLAYFTQDHKLLYLQENQTLRTSWSYGITYSYRKNFYETHALRFGYRRSHIADTIAILNPNYFGEGRTSQDYSSLVYSFNSEHRDVVLYPLRGYQLTGYIQQSGLGLSNTVNQWEANISYAKHFDLKRKNYLSNFSSLYFAAPEAQPYTLYGAMGYRRQLVRGYEIYVVEGPLFALNKTTFKRKIFSKIYRWESFPFIQFRHFPVALYWKSYADFGYVQNYQYYQDRNLNTMLTNKLLAGYGTGFDLVMLYDTVIRFEYTFTNNNNRHGFFLAFRKEF